MAEYIDFDTHVYEPMSVWSDFIEPQFRDRVPTWVQDDSGRLMARIDEQLYPTAPGHPGYARIYGEAAKVDRSGNEPQQRLKYMDSQGAHIQVIFPTLGLAGFPGSVRDGKLAAAYARAYNRYMGEFTSANRERLRGAMLVPANHPELAAEEMRWACKSAGLKLAVLTPTPPGDIPWSDSSRDPIWRAAAECAVTVVFHETTAGCPSNAIGIHRYRGNWPMTYLCTHVMEAMLAFADLILGGTLARFPDLRVGAAEAHVHWLPAWLALIDQNFGAGTKIWSDTSGEAALKLKPSDYFKRQCFVAAFPEDTMLAEALQFAPDSIVVCSDWPHPIAQEHSYEGLRGVASNPGFSEEAKRRLLIENPRRFL
jgi:predicted TIM-barrel fold metal-dependent hydrolase